MIEDELDDWLRGVLDAKLSRDELFEALRGRLNVSDAVVAAPVARVDYERPRRQGVVEAVFGESKSFEEVDAIVAHMLERKAPLLVTRIHPEKAQRLVLKYPGVQWEERANLLFKLPDEPLVMQGRVAVVAAMRVVRLGISHLFFHFQSQNQAFSTSSPRIQPLQTRCRY